MRLNIGSGGQLLDGWWHLDRGFTPETMERAAQMRKIGMCELLEIELTDLPLPFADDSVSVAVAHHSLCMFAPDELRRLTADLARVLEPGAVLRVSSVDYRHAIRALVRRDIGWFARLGVPDHDGDPASTFLWYLEWGGARKTVLYCPEQLGVEYLEPAGFRWEQVALNETLTRSGTICELDSREDESWFLEAVR